MSMRIVNPIGRQIQLGLLHHVSTIPFWSIQLGRRLVMRQTTNSDNETRRKNLREIGNFSQATANFKKYFWVGAWVMHLHCLLSTGINLICRTSLFRSNEKCFKWTSFSLGWKVNIRLFKKWGKEEKSLHMYFSYTVSVVMKKNSVRAHFLLALSFWVVIFWPCPPPFARIVQSFENFFNNSPQCKDEMPPPFFFLRVVPKNQNM